MTDTALDEDECLDDEEEALGPSRALPPLYVLRTADRCPECGEASHVYALGCAAFHDAEDRRPVAVFHFLREIRAVPEELTAVLKVKCPSFFLDQEDGTDQPYLMNHCDCGARLDDAYLHGDVGAAFWPDTPDGYRRFTLFELPIDEEIPVACSYSVGGDEFLDFAQARPWADL